MTKPEILEVSGVSVQFGGVKALDNIDFKLGVGELRCLIGPNGAGKTTFFKCITGQLHPTAGRIAFKGQSMSHAESFEIARAGMGIKTQVPNLFDGLTVNENVWLAARRLGGSKQRKSHVNAILERMGVAHLSSFVVGQLAHGQRQLVELSLVIAADPELVLLDEPAAGMTHDEVGVLADTIRQINKTHALIVVEHDMQFIRMIAKDVTVFHQGRILVEGPVERVLSDTTVRDVYLGKPHG
ncbi:ABC transporter ATP-binding protein [Bradyrhizobium diazoefficiens]|nr:ABC transporter ATP-binding protein [Bradyrhizobium diazoefficiens]QQN66716.1 ABC transporter ATP-binding protein [Bradyrhizobium diazoefficiens]